MACKPIKTKSIRKAAKRYGKKKKTTKSSGY